MANSSGDVISCVLEAQETYEAGEPVLLRFSLQNQGAEALHVLRWYTPLEGLAGDILRVTREGEDIPYRGILAKRGSPVPGDYVTLAPGAAVSAQVDLAQSYDLSRSGRYQVTFASRLQDVAARRSSVPRKQDAHQPRELSCGSVSFTIVAPDD